MSERDGVELGGGRFARPVRDTDVVHRRFGRGVENVHALLGHLRRAGITEVPSVVQLSHERGTETLSYIAGDTGVPPLNVDMRSDDALVDAVRLVRRIHDATTTFMPPSDRWQYQELARSSDTECIGHLDLAPWNFVFDGTSVVGLIDWDTAAPTTRAWDLSYLAYQFAPLHDDASLPVYGWDEVPDRRARLRLIASTYGGVSVAELLDVLPVRLAATAALMDRQVRRGDPDYAVHAEEAHARGWRDAAARVISLRDSLI